MRRVIAGSTLALGLALGLASPAQADVEDGVIHVPQDFVTALSDTRAAGHYEVEGSALRVWTDGSTVRDAQDRDTNKVAEYVATSTPLATVGEPKLNYTATKGETPPGFQLVVDFDNDTTPDGILIGEPKFYGDRWWLNDKAADFVKKAGVHADPTTGPTTGYAFDGTLAQWRAAFPNANVVAFGFSLGSGVTGDGVLASIEFAGKTYTFAETVILTSKDECKGRGWATSTDPVYKNQGQCVSAFASAKAKPTATPTPTAVRQPAATVSVVKTVATMWPFA